MKQRKLILESTHDRAIVEARYPIFKSQADMFAETLCPKGTNKEHYKTECLNRKCQNCGVAYLLLMPEENDTTDEAIEVTWEKFEYVNVCTKGIWKEKLMPEHFFVVSNDDKHDHHFVHEVQNPIKEYLNSISYNVSTMHEYTDGCQCQYKSRHCMGDVSNGQQDFGYDRLIRNYFETSHAKGPQDAAGGYVKRQADLAILRRKATIQTAHDFYKFANENLQETRDSSVCLRRVFRFIDNIDRNRDRYFKSIPQNRNIHQIISEREGLLSVRNLSCYSCDSCLLNMAHSCQHTELVGLVKNIQTEKERGCAIVEDISPDDDFEVVDMIRKGSLVALYTDDEGEDFYLMKAGSCQEKLKSSETDDWQGQYPEGTTVIRGLYYRKTGPLSYSLIKRKNVIVSVKSVLYVTNDILTDSVTDLSLAIHEEIIGLAEQSSL
ncbi:unnamed protein product [Mytilus edulis]|uniref:Uncharacterized protein n=1 Tax=Mytilus edulis TaxID=6550 RepID=A0A8S3VEQ7_MYTED|nr:unnamed protein product [Mytilus edulis]